MQQDPTTERVHVKAPARLHLGFLDLNGGLGRVYGSIGMAIEEPATILTLSRAATNKATGKETVRAAKTLDRFTQALGLQSAYHVDITQAIPAHSGLGSGTQLAIAIGSALSLIENQRHSIFQLGEMQERGARSAIGLAAFQAGGFIVDGGRGKRDHAPPVLSQLAFPDDWRVLLVLDGKETGVHGERETKAFQNLEPMPEEAAAHLCRLALMRLLPSLAEHDLKSFGSCITEIQEIVGSHFAKAQGGGIWSSPDVAEIVTRMGEAGAVGLGQSSWGPTGFAFAPDQAAAERLYHSFVEDAKRRGLEIMIVRGRNRGAAVGALASPAEQIHEGRPS